MLSEVDGLTQAFNALAASLAEYRKFMPESLFVLDTAESVAQNDSQQDLGEPPAISARQITEAGPLEIGLPSLPLPNSARQVPDRSSEGAHPPAKLSASPLDSGFSSTPRLCTVACFDL
eukprot:RCo046031